jgi:carbamoyl-phosphate synthase large subunit
MLGRTVADLRLAPRRIPYCGVKEVVLPFSMFPEVDPVLGPEMRSTGEVLGLAPTFGLAYFKAEEAAQPPLPLGGAVLISVTDRDKPAILDAARRFHGMGFRIFATAGTRDYLVAHGVPSELSFKLHEQRRPHIVDQIVSRDFGLIINTPIGKLSQFDDAYIRKAAIKHKVPYITTAAAARASALGVMEARGTRASVLSLQEYHAQLRL